jgi:hypothetical protein
MTSTTPPTGPFTCYFELHRVRPPKFVREERQRVTYLTARDYEATYTTTLYFASGAQLSIKARLIGELNQSVVVRDQAGRPLRRSGYVQGLTEISTHDGEIVFRGRYYDSRALQPLAGDDALTPVGATLVDHLENALGEGLYAGHAFSMGVHLIREGEGPLRGNGPGHID